MNKVLIYLTLALTTVTLAVACGKSDDGGGSSGGTTAATPTTCQSGYLHHSTYGCLPQGSCGANSAMYNNQCIVVQVTNVNQAQNCTGAGQVFSTTRNACLSQGNCGYGYAQYNNTCEYVGNNVNYQNNQYNGYQYQNGYFYPQYPNYYGNGYNNGYNGYNGYNQYNNGWGLRGGVWFRYY